jgi:hypothetical protein
MKNYVILVFIMVHLSKLNNNLLPAQLEKGRILSKNLGLGSKSFKRVKNEVTLTLIKVSGVVPSHSSRKSFSWVEKNHQRVGDGLANV